MTVTTTRRLADLREECSEAGIVWMIGWSREECMDALREKFGAFDRTTEIDPMKANPTKDKITIGDNGPDYSGIANLLTDEYFMEPKLDGARMRMFIGLNGSTLNTGRRNVKTFSYTDRSGNFPHLAQVAGEKIGKSGIILDGELLAPSSKIQTHTGNWTDSLLNASVALTTAKPEGSVATQLRFGNAIFHAFDVLAYDGVDLLTEPYIKRRVVLEKVCEAIQYQYPTIELECVPKYESTTTTINMCIASGYEGVVIKGKHTPYLPGKRKGWHKVKNFNTADGFITGFMPGKDRNEGFVGSLILSLYGKESNGISPVIEVAQTGNLTDAFRNHISAEDGTLKKDWYGRVIEWSAQGITKNLRARHAYMVRLRPDKIAQDCMWDQLANFPLL